MFSEVSLIALGLPCSHPATCQTLVGCTGRFPVAIRTPSFHRNNVSFDVSITSGAQPSIERSRLSRSRQTAPVDCTLHLGLVVIPTAVLDMHALHACMAPCDIYLKGGTCTISLCTLAPVAECLCAAVASAAVLYRRRQHLGARFASRPHTSAFQLWSYTVRPGCGQLGAHI